MTRIGRPRRAAWLAALALVVTGSPASGQGAGGQGAGEASGADRLRLTWSATEGCPSEGDVLAEVRRQLGGRAGAAEEGAGAPIPVAATVQREAGGSFVVRLEAPGDGATQVRELRGATCKAVTDAAALILALMIDPEAAMRGPGGDGSEGGGDGTGAAGGGASGGVSGDRAGADAPRAIEGPQKAGGSTANGGQRAAEKLRETSVSRGRQSISTPREAESASSIELRLGAWAGADIGSLPGVAPGFGALGAIAFGAPRVSLGFAIWPDKSGYLGALPTAGGDVRILTGDLGVCAALLESPLELAPCAAVEVGQIRARGFGVSETGEGSRVWAAFKVGGALVWRPLPAPLDDIGLTARLDLVLPLTRPQFVLEGFGEVHRPAAGSGRGALGLEVRF